VGRTFLFFVDIFYIDFKYSTVHFSPQISFETFWLCQIFGELRYSSAQNRVCSFSYVRHSARYYDIFTQFQIALIPGFRRDVDDICALLGYYTS
jgi:hypothetical protein